MYEDVNSIKKTSNHEDELVKLEYQEIGQIYLDPIDIYMDKFFITEQQSISSISIVLQVYQAPCNEDQAGNLYQIPLTALFLNWVKNNERAKVLDPIFDWLYWIFHID